MSKYTDVCLYHPHSPTFLCSTALRSQQHKSVKNVKSQLWDGTMTTPLLYVTEWETQTVAVRRKADGYKLLLMTRMREKDRKGEQHFDDIIR